MKGGSIPEWGEDLSVAGLLRYQAGACARVGSPLYGNLLAHAAEDYEAGGATARVLEGHERDAVGSALALRLMGAVHRLVLDGRCPQLAERYARGEREPEAAWPAFHAVLVELEREVRELIERPVQTNEAGRCAALLPAFFEVAAAGLPLRLLEVGASAGLNLRWDAYRYEAADGAFSWGPADSPVRIEFELEGRAPRPVDVAVAERRGCDPAPIDPTDGDARLTLLSFVWPDQPARIERMRSALALAPSVPARVERAGAVDWVRQRLAEPAVGRASVVYHSLVMQYLDPPARDGFREQLELAGRAATSEAPLAWLRMEPDGDRAAVALTIWPGGEERLLARAGYHGDPVEPSSG